MIFWGTFFPLISEAITGERSSLGSPWFDRYTAPLAILLVLFTGIGPLLAWRRVSAGALWRLVRAPLAVAVAATIAVAALTDALSEPVALVLFAFAFFALAALGAEFWRGAAAQRALDGELGRLAALARVVGRNRRRYGGYIVHAGIALLLIAVAASSSFQTSADLRLLPGESGEVGDYTVTYVEPTSSIDAAEQRLNFGAALAVERDGEPFATLRPSRNYYSSVAAGGRCAASSRARRRARSVAGHVRVATCGRRCAPTWPATTPSSRAPTGGSPVRPAPRAPSRRRSWPGPGAGSRASPSPGSLSATAPTRSRSTSASTSTRS